MNTKVLWDSSLIEKYSISGPRYTSYPTALQFEEDGFSEQRLVEVLEQGDATKPLSIYIHIPFCENICYYCACNKVITKDRSKTKRYIAALLAEAKRIAAHVKGREVQQMHWGGGTPTFLNNEEIAEVVNTLKEYFNFAEEGDYSIEIDPRRMDHKTLPELSRLGFNRISLGVQDFDEKVQKAVNRIQPESMTRNVLINARKYGFESINVDLIYGLPFQSEKSFSETVDKIIEMAPDRLSVFNYAHLPHRFKPQRRIDAKDLPSPSEKLAILEMTIQKLTKAGYVYIGMDHFALPHDELTHAQQNGDLHRNFQGYTTNADCDLLGLGVSSISQVSNCFIQNQRDLTTYYECVENDSYALWRGYESTAEDKLRHDVIMQLICLFNLKYKEIERTHGIDFRQHFASEIEELKTMEADGLLSMDDEGIEVTDTGRLLIRNICMTFDEYFKELKALQIYSKAI
ncbi:oxygen-independent coproporphyrinogen III oxidase [Kangiella sediminilitoris]|uniref:Coproporphyrinogen-III oxidase n=1 Tax=Kangiella sediminilitoris TaxID=1144748 RepID=A0A1B3BCV1_9GAMM|nr:oxygen-independent coproporphyrinogen III oxidase [Kangiella sediminilitoris]AOE50595.1 coproporphyrinogen III oxidase [Kangiella sediminilitoris]